MFKKLFALASVTALFGVVSAAVASGCSSSTPQPAAPDASTTPPAHEAGVVNPVDAGPDDTPDAGPSTCPTTDPIDATGDPWKSPATPQPGACAEKDITDLVAYVDANSSATYAQIKASVTNATCASCLFVPDGATWGPFVENADGSFERLNFGGCVAIASGKDACGKGYSQLDDCNHQACKACADSALNDCLLQAANDACKNAANAYVAACAGADGETPCNALAKEFDFEAAARALCVAIPDGGTGDAGDGDAGDAGDAGDGGDSG